MEKSIEYDPKMTFQSGNPTIAGAVLTVCELPEDSGSCRWIGNRGLNLHLLSDSLVSEQQKLSHVLNWAHRFLSGGSEVHLEFCRADSLMLADEEPRETHKKTLAYEHSSAAKDHHPASCTASLWREKECRGSPEYMKRLELLDANNKQTPSQDNNCRRSGLIISNQGRHTNSSGRNTNETLASDGATCSIKESTSCWADVENMVFGTASTSKLSYKTAGAQSERDTSGQQMEPSEVDVEGKVGTKKEVAKEGTKDIRMVEKKGRVNEAQEFSSAFEDYSKTEPEKTPMDVTSRLSFSCQLKIPPTLSVYEQYQLCVDKLHHLRVRRSQHIQPGCFIESPAPGTAPEKPEINKRLNESGNKRVTEITKRRSSGVMSKTQDRDHYNISRTILTEYGQIKHRAPCRPVFQRNRVTCSTHLDLDSNKCDELITGIAGDCPGGRTSADNVTHTTVEQLGIAPGDNVPAVEKNAALITKKGLFPVKIGRNPGLKACRSGVKGQKTKAWGPGGSLRFCERSSIPLSSPTNTEIIQRTQRENKHTPEDKVRPSSPCRHRCQPQRETHTPLHDDPGPTSSALGACRCKLTEYNPAGVPVCERWLSLPDEVWISILSLLPHSDLCRVLQVCSRLHTLATDHTLWRNLRLENSQLTEGWLLCVGRRRPRSLCLHSCSGLSLTSRGLEMVFTLCRDFLEELKVTNCTGLGLHGDQVLLLVGQLCQHVTSVDVSWSGATDTGVKALSDCCPGLRLKSVVLNGCHITDDPLKKLVMRHKESLCRLEVFGCQFLTPSCLQTVYKMCPGLQHLNIGQLPKVDASSLAVMTSQLKCLISLNLTGLQVVTDATVDTLLQNCVELQSLTFSSCPGVTDLTLHSIRKYTPCIRSLDVSGCKAVTDAGVQSLALGCRRLQHLNLSSTGTGNRGVSLLANYCSGHLHTVKLNFCHITLENILKLCRCCKRLKVLHLYGCARLPAEREIREVNSTVRVHPLS